MQIPNHIEKYITKLDLSLASGEFPKEIEETLKRSVLAGGKRFRPLLLFSFGELLNIDCKKLEVFAECVEQIHAATLSHDDVIDNATYRRDNPSINILAGNKRAVLAGDFLLADVLEKVVRQENLPIMKETAKVIQNLSLGEWLQMDLIGSRNFDFQKLKAISYNKTGSLIGWCMVIPAELAKLSLDLVDQSRELGRSLGLAFQMVDDLLDFSESAKKDSMADLQNGQINFVINDYFSRNNELKKKYLKGENWLEQLDDKELQLSRRNISVLASAEIAFAKKCLQHIIDGRNDHNEESYHFLLSTFDALIDRCY